MECHIASAQSNRNSGNTSCVLAARLSAIDDQDHTLQWAHLAETSFALYLSDYQSKYVAIQSAADWAVFTQGYLMAEEHIETVWLDHTMEIDGAKWLKGYGNLPSDIMFIGEKPSEDDQHYNAIFSGQSGKLLFTLMRTVGIKEEICYFTNAVKHLPRKKALNAGDIKKCQPVLQEEIKRVSPKIIVCLGAVALKAVLGKNFLLSDYRGAVVDHPTIPNTKVFCTYNPAYILRNPSAEETFVRDLEALARIYGGGTIASDVTTYEVITTVEQLLAFKQFLFNTYAKPLISLDCEWHGATWMSKNRYIRTVQLGFKVGAAIIVKFTGENGVQVMDDPPTAWKVLKEILEDPRMALLGHNVISDGQWLLTYDIDIRPHVVFDTMLAEHLLNESGPFGLEELTLKYTNMGRYDLDVMKWKKEHKVECKDGFGPIPDELLLPYGAKDVDTTLRIAYKQMPLLEQFMKPRGEYPSLWDTTMATQETIYELEIAGMNVDPERLSVLTKIYNEKMIGLESQLRTAALQYGMEDFNYNSTHQVCDLLFNRLHLIPVKTTKGKKWDEFAPYETSGVDNRTPSTDHNTLEIIQDKHPIVKMLLNLRKIGTVVKYFLREDEDEGEVVEENQNKTGGGIASKIWPDGRLHAHFSQLSETGRFKHSKPNVANWPKKSEGSMEEIFGGKDKVPPLIRTIVIPTPGMVMMEADFEQAELFVLASLSQDKNMLDALNTPGKDLHDLTAISAFNLQVLTPDGVPMDETFMLNLAKTDKDAFEAYRKTLGYVDQRGKHMTRAEFKDTIRVASKKLNFGKNLVINDLWCMPK